MRKPCMSRRIAPHPPTFGRWEPSGAIFVRMFGAGFTEIPITAFPAFGKEAADAMPSGETADTIPFSGGVSMRGVLQCIPATSRPR